MKLAVVGGGSTYTPELVDGLIRMRELLPVDELALHDVDEERLEILDRPDAADARARRPPVRLTATTRLEDAVEGATPC